MNYHDDGADHPAEWLETPWLEWLESPFTLMILITLVGADDWDEDCPDDEPENFDKRPDKEDKMLPPPLLPFEACCCDPEFWVNLMTFTIWDDERPCDAPPCECACEWPWDDGALSWTTLTYNLSEQFKILFWKDSSKMIERKFSLCKSNHQLHFVECAQLIFVSRSIIN